MLVRAAYDNAAHMLSRALHTTAMPAKGLSLEEANWVRGYIDAVICRSVLRVNPP